MKKNSKLYLEGVSNDIFMVYTLGFIYAMNVFYLELKKPENEYGLEGDFDLKVLAILFAIIWPFSVFCLVAIKYLFYPAKHLMKRKNK